MKRLLACFLFSGLLIISGCGGGSTSAPTGSTITINPATFTLTDASATVSTHTQYFTVSVKNLAGASLGNTKIVISSPFAVPDSSGYVQLYNGTTKMDSPFEAETDNFGIYQLRFDYTSGGARAYAGNLEARSGSAFGTASFSIAAQ